MGVVYLSTKIVFGALTKFLIGVILVGALIFLPAGTLNYFNGALLMAILFIPIAIAGIAMLIKNPALLEARLKGKEKQRDQDIVVKLSGLMFIAGFIVAGLGFRFGWYTLPKAVSIGACFVFILAYILYAEVMRENTYLFRTIEVQENQRVIDTGLYGIVRHPMYFATILLFLSIPVILGSVYSLIIFLAFPMIIVKRIKGEEKLLEKELNGYAEYKQKVKYRLIPFIW